MHINAKYGLFPFTFFGTTSVEKKSMQIYGDNLPTNFRLYYCPRVQKVHILINMQLSLTEKKVYVSNFWKIAILRYSIVLDLGI